MAAEDKNKASETFEDSRPLWTKALSAVRESRAEADLALAKAQKMAAEKLNMALDNLSKGHDAADERTVEFNLHRIENIRNILRT